MENEYTSHNFSLFATFLLKLSKLVEIWRSYGKNNFVQFFETRCRCWMPAATAHQPHFYNKRRLISCSDELFLLILISKLIFVINSNVCYMRFILANYPWFYSLFIFLVIRAPNIVVGGLKFCRDSVFYLFRQLLSELTLNRTQPKPATCLKVGAIWKCMSEVWGIPSP